MKSEELKTVLLRLEELYAAGGMLAAAKDFRNVAHLLNSEEEEEKGAQQN